MPKDNLINMINFSVIPELKEFCRWTLCLKTEDGFQVSENSALI